MSDEHTNDHDDPRPESSESGSERETGHRSADDQAREAYERLRAERERRRAERWAERRQRRAERHGRKERVLHTRISEQLSDDIRRLAEDLRVPTSNLVRNVLEEVFTVVETVSGDVGDLLDDVLEEAGAARDRVRRQARHGSRPRSSRRDESWADAAEAEIRRDEAREEPESGRSAPRERPVFPDVIGWQPMVLNQSQDCADCNRSIRRGSRAFVGITEGGISRTTLCRDCLQDR